MDKITFISKLKRVQKAYPNHKKSNIFASKALRIKIFQAPMPVWQFTLPKFTKDNQYYLLKNPLRVPKVRRTVTFILYSHSTFLTISRKRSA